MDKKLILVVNDDGITAPGISTLIRITKQFGEVVVVAPNKPQSGMGHAITINNTLRVEKTIVEGCTAYSCTGTPVDCVKLAVNVILDRKPDLIVSGINHGSNASINVLYSGTMSAAVEGALEQIPSIGFSLLDHSIDANFTHSESFVKHIIEQSFKYGIKPGTCLNVNIPAVSKELIKGIKICRQADANWIEEFDERKDPQGNTYYWLTGKFENRDEEEDTDLYALANNYVSIVPVQYDVTDYKQLSIIQEWDLHINH